MPTRIQLARNCFVFKKLTLILILFAIRLQAQEADTSAVRQLHNKAIHFLSSYPDSLLYYRDSSFHLAQLINDEVGMIDGYIDLGIYHWVKGNYADAIEAYNLAYQKSVGTNQMAKLPHIYTNQGMVYSRLGDYPKAINYFLESLKLSQSSNQSEITANTYNSLGVAYSNNGNIDDALSSYLKSLRLYRNSGNALRMAGIYTNIGNIYQSKGTYDSALAFQRRALFMFDSLNNPRGLAVSYNNIANVYFRLNRLDEALDFSLKALEISKAQDFFSSQVSALEEIAIIKREQNKTTEAIQILQEAIQLAEAKNYRTALVNLYKELSNCFKRTNRTNEALDYFEKYSALKDSIFNSQNVSTISNLRLAYEVENKETEIKLLTLDNEVTKISRNFAISAVALILLMAGMIVARQRLKIRLNSQLLKKQEELYLTQKAVAFLESKNSKLKEEELKRELDYKNQSLSTYALNMVQKNEILEEVRKSVEQILRTPEDQQSQFKQLSKLVDYSLSLDKDWDDFKIYFNEVHRGFFDSLQERFPDLSSAEIKLCALLRLNMSMKQVATILRISPESVKMGRHRLRKKLNLQTEENLVNFVMSL